VLTSAVVLAFVAGVCSVPAAWEALAALERVRPVALVGRLLAPFGAARRSGREATPPERRRLALLGALVLLGAGWLVSGPLGALALAAAGPALVAKVLAVRRRRWRLELGEGAPAAARALADALAGGHSVRGALLEAGHRGGVAGAAGVELRAAAVALGLGEPTETVLARVADRAGDPGWDTLVAAVLLQREAGGDLAGLLRGVAAQLEAAARSAGEARAVTAQARFTALVVTLMPVAGLALAELAGPGFLVSLASTPLTAALAAGGLVLQGAALLLVRRLARVPA